MRGGRRGRVGQERQKQGAGQNKRGVERSRWTGWGEQRRCVCLYPRGERRQKRESETERCRNRDRDGESGERDKERRAGGKTAAVGPPGPSASCFADTRSSGPHTVVLWGVCRCPQNLKGPRRPCVRGVSNSSLSPCPQRQGLDGPGPTWVQCGGSELTLGDHDGETGAGARGAGPAPPTCSLCLRLPQPVATSSRLPAPTASCPFCAPQAIPPEPTFQLPFGFGVREGCPAAELGRGLGGLLSMYRTAADMDQEEEEGVAVMD